MTTIKELEYLIGIFPDKTISKLDIFFINSNLDSSKRKELVKILSEIKNEPVEVH